MSDEYSLLNDWCKEDNIPRENIDFKGYVKFESSALGYMSVYMGKSNIYIQQVLEKTSIAKYGVLWHEYCHSYVYDKYRKLGHISKWWSKFLTKPQYVILSGFAQIIYPFIKEK